MITKFNNCFGCDVTERSRNAGLVTIRNTCIAYMLSAGYGLTETGKVFKRHHATIWHSGRRFNDLYSIGDKQTVESWEKINKYMEQ